MEPLVTVMTPCYNSAHTLSWALASLIAQTYTNWECVVVDDGSSDNPQTVVQRFGDRRLRFFRLEKRMGRGAARQFALAQAQGQYVCMLDADDWLYPAKLAEQVAFMETHPAHVLVSSSMAIVDSRNDLVGVRCRPGKANRRGPSTVPMAFAPSMIRLAAARATGFDSNYLAAEDLEFLERLLANGSYSILDTPMYVYAEAEAVTLEKYLFSMQCLRRMLWKNIRKYPLSAGKDIIVALSKAIIYRIAFATGLGPVLVSRRSSAPTDTERHRFQAARGVVDQTHRTAIGSCFC